MATALEGRVVNAAGLVQGITLVTFPAASTILTSAEHYGLSNTQYGALFLPQVATAITASLAASRLSRTFTAKRVLLVGLAANLTSVVLVLISATLQTDQSVAYPLLLLSTAFLGVGFGLTVPSLNTFVAEFRPQAVDRAVLVLNALLGLGTVLAPVFVAIFVGLGFWWGLPLLSAVLLLAILGIAARQPLRTTTTDSSNAGAGSAVPGRTTAGIPMRFWLFAAFATLYGVCETMNGNWSQQYMTTELGSSATQASLALTAFWAMVTLGRVGFAALGRRVPSRVTYHLLPFVLVVSFLVIATVSHGQVWVGVAVFALAGLGCSALLPLTISLGQRALTGMSAAVAGGVIACYQLGYGLAAFGVGPLLDSGHSLAGIYQVTSLLAAAMGILSFVLARSPGRRNEVS